MMAGERYRAAYTDHAVLLNKDLEVDDEFLTHFAKDKVISPGKMEEIEVMGICFVFYCWVLVVIKKCYDPLATTVNVHV